MATNAAPIYGKQYIRYAETWEALTNAQPGSPLFIREQTAGVPLPGVGAVEVGELRAVAPIFELGANKAAPPDSLAPANWTGQICGVNQAYMPTALARPAFYRELTVATSGLLLVEVQLNPDPPLPPVGPIPPNTQLKVNLFGQAVPPTTAAPAQFVTLDGTEPTIRQEVTIGGRRLVLVSFN